MKRLLILLALTPVVAACPSDEPPVLACVTECTLSNQCAVGEICTDSCCAPFEGCCNDPGAPCACPSDKICSEAGDCVDVTEICLTQAPNGCECHVLNDVGEIEAVGVPTITLPAGESRSIQAVVAEVGGNPVPGATFQLTVDNANFTADSTAGTITAAGTAGTSVLTVEPNGLIGDVACTANLTNLGAPSNTRFFVFNDITGAGVTGATVIVDEGNTGASTVGVTESMSTPGMYQTDAAITGIYNVTVFAANHNIASLVGLAASNDDMGIPISPRATDPDTGGFTGRMDYDLYEQRYLNNRAKAIKFGLVAGSIPLRSILNFDLELFLGSFDTSLDCDLVPRPAGCYEIKITGLVDTVAPLPGGVILSLANTPIKSFFDSVSQPGRRFAWSLGGEIEVADIAPLIDVLTPLFDMGGMGMDPDVNIGQIFDGLIPLFSGFASGVQGNLPLQPVALSEWNDYLACGGATNCTYQGRDFTEMRFPRLDDERPADLGKLQLRESLRVFTDFTVPDLPPDPENSVMGATMEGMVLLTGVNTDGYGFVPLGLGAALDCTDSSAVCLDRAMNPGAFDNVVNGGTMCFFDPDPKRNACPPGVPEQVANGHVGLFHAPAHSGLEKQDWLTVAVALPLSSLTEDDAAIRVTAVVINEEPTPGASSQLATASYPAQPSVPANVNGRTYDPGNSGHDLHWVTVASPENMAGDTTRWNIFYGDGDPAAFTAPAIPAPLAAAFQDPFAPVMGMTGTVVNVTHLGFDLGGADTLESLAANNGTALTNMVDNLAGFAFTSKDVPAM